jgi:hypothetical protein
MTGGVLALDILNFDATRIGNDAELTWKSTAPEWGDRFIIEHSRDGIKFNKIGEVPAEVDVYNYELTDFDPGPGRNYYKITSESTDGNQRVSGVRLVEFEMDTIMVIKPTPADSYIEVDTQNEGHGMIISSDGKEFLSLPLGALERKVIDIGSLPSGQYYLVLDSGGVVTVGAFTKL